MSLFVKRLVSPIETEVDINVVIQTLQSVGYTAVISEAKAKFADVFERCGMPLQDVSEESTSSPLRDIFLERQFYIRHSEDVPSAGDIILKEGAPGFLYIVLYSEAKELINRRRGKSTKLPPVRVEVGYMGDEKNAEVVSRFVKDTSEALSQGGAQDLLEWSEIDTYNEQFAELTTGETTQFVEGSFVTAQDVVLADILENVDIRKFAMNIKKGGGILASDLAKRDSKISDSQSPITLERLIEAQLLSKEYVVICKRTSSLVNRLPNLDALESVSQLGFLCSCGRPISEERIEEFIVPTDLLQKMLNQSFWTTARLMKSLRSIGVLDSRVVLNLREGADEIDAFVNLDGNLVMVELKDNMFSMGHAYPFGGRISQYKPAYAFIVSTGGIEEEVKKHFERIKPETKIVYVASLEELDSALEKVATDVRFEVVNRVLEGLEVVTMLGVPLTHVTNKKLKAELRQLNRKGPEVVA